MIRFMLDTDQPLQLEAGAALVATYADLYSAEVVSHLAPLCKAIIWIDRGLGDHADKATVYDIEAGANTVAGFPHWLDRRRALGASYLTGYCDRATLPAVNQVAAGRQFWHWIATLDGTAHVDGFTPGHTPAAVQCISAAMLGFHADGSLVLGHAWNPTR